MLNNICMKTCKECGGSFDREKFAKKNPGRCIPCYAEHRKKHYEANRERILEECKIKRKSLSYNDKQSKLKEERKRRKIYVDNNKEKIKEYRDNYNKLYHLKNREILKQKYYDNHEVHIQRSRTYRSNRTPEQLLRDKEKQQRYSKNNRERINELRRLWMKDPQNKIAHNLRTRVRQSLQLNKSGKAAKTEELTGISYKGLRTYLESKFVSGMTWNNYGEWHIDHIIPINYFDLSVEENQRICFNYRNLQPLWKFENISKNDKITISDVEDFISDIRISL